MSPETINLPKADEFQAYNYIMLFSSGNIKIGMTTDPLGRIKQLSNSNSGGFKLVDAEFSQPHYIADTVEKVLHWHYHENRVEGEFFSELDYEEVKKHFFSMFERRDFINSNNVRKDFCLANHRQRPSSKKKYD